MHQMLGIHAVVNARAGLYELNNLTNEDIEMRRDADKINNRLQNRVRFYQFNSKHFRKQQTRLAHLLSSYDD